jgi:salicylate hydroxylase
MSTESYFQIEVPKVKMETDAALSQLYNHPGTTLWLGPDRYIIAASMRKRNVFTAAIFDYSSQRPGKNEPWVVPNYDIELVRRQYSSFDPAIIGKLLERAEACLKWTTSRLAPLPGWTSHNGKVVLIGDAAHALLPDAGQVR